MITPQHIKDHNSDVYYPHSITTRSAKGSDSRVKETVYSLRNLQEINTLASDTPVIDTRAELFREKKSLHEHSQGKVKGWGRTIFGARLKRLAAANEKARLLEVERQRIDKEWREIAEKERQDSLNRSRMLQKCEEPRFRNLHSQMLMSNVLMERDKQLEYKVQRIIAERIHEKEEVLKMRMQYLQSLDKEKEKQEKQLQKRLDFAQGLKEAVDRKGNESQDTFVDRENGKRLATEIRQEFAKQAAIDYQKKLKEAIDIKATLAQQIKEKQDKVNLNNQRVFEMEEANARFNEMKNVLSEKRKDFTYQQAAERIKRSEEVAQWNIKANTEANQTREQFLAAVQQSHDARIIDREVKKANNRQQFLEEKAAFEQKHKEKKRLAAEEEKLTKVKERLQHLAQSDLWKKESLAIAERKKKSLLAIKEEQVEQMLQHANQRQKCRDERMKRDLTYKAQSQRDNAEFDDYAASVIEQWSNEGKNVGPILAVIEKERPGYTKGRGGPKHKKLDHFSRLGFNARDLPDPNVSFTDFLRSSSHE